ncbi:MAG: amidohydrolase, partial [Rubricoccaceae bacterium]
PVLHCAFPPAAFSLTTRSSALAALLLASFAVSAQPVRYVATGGLVYTVDEPLPRAEAFAVEDGRFVWVGSDTEAAARYPAWPRLDLAGRTVVPGLIDAHAHLTNLGHALLSADLAGASSKAETLARLRAFEAGLPPGAWLTGRGWDQNVWAEADGAFPTRHDLDAAFPERPVWLVRIDGHAAWGNTAALRAAGLDPEAPAPAAPAGGAILTDAAGRPTGVFIDAAMPLVGAAVPARSAEEEDEALTRALRETARHGLTGVHEAGLSLADVARYRRFIAEGRFPLRLYGMAGGDGDVLAALCAGGPIVDPSGRLAVRALKLYADGALGSRGAALLDDYHDDPGNRGLFLTAPETLRTLATRAMRCGVQVNTHAIGDAGGRAVLEAYEHALTETGGGPGRHRIEHAQVLDLDDLPRLARLGLIASVQPTHATSDMGWAEARVGPERIRGAYAWRRLVDSGARLALGSDFPVERVSPLLGFYAAVTRQDADGRPAGGWYGNQVLTRAEALRGFTLDAAYAAFMEDEVGSITPGKRADFVILSDDLMTVPPERLLAIEVVATYLDGAPIFER